MRLFILAIFGTAPLLAVETTWIYKSYMGGPLCAKRGPEINFVAPGTEAASASLKSRNIRIYRSFFKNQPTCQACGKCPTYHREIFFEIESSKIAEANKANFHQAPVAPSVDELSEFERGKIFRPPPDLPPEDR